MLLSLKIPFIITWTKFYVYRNCSICDYEINAISLNNSGDWIALASSNLGNLLVWEWQSETYVMKQQGHTNNMTCLSYSPDGMYLATGGIDGKVFTNLN